MSDYYYSQLNIAKELFAKTQYDTALSILLKEIDDLENQQQYLLLSEYLHIIISSYINKSDITTVEPLLERLNYALIKSNHPTLKVSYSYHVGCFFFLTCDLDSAIEMFEKTLAYIDYNQHHPYFLKISIALSSWHLAQGNLARGIYYRDSVQHLAPSAKHEAPQIYNYYMSVHARCSMLQGELDVAYEALMNIWEHPVLIQDVKTHMLTACQLGEYYCKMNDSVLADTFFKECWALASQITDLQFQLYLLTKIIMHYEKLRRFEDAYHFSKIKTAILESEFLQRQQERLHQFALKAKQDSSNLLAYIDKLTQIHNRHYFEEHFEQWLNVAKDANGPLCCALFDVDNFKEKNDIYGHITGDQILQAIGNVTKKYEVDEELFIARYGGDEFIIVSKEPALFEYTIELLFQELQSIEIPFGDTMLTFTISLGAVSIKDVSQLTIADIIQKADEQLYIVKRAGKNHFQFA